MKRSDKEQLVSELRDKIEGAKALYFTDFTGLNVKRMTDLRRRLRKAGVEYVVIAEAPDDEAITRVSLAVSSQGNVRTNTFRVFSEQEALALVEDIR